VRVVRHGSPLEVIEVRDDVDVPEPGPGEVRVAVRAASLNWGDIARCRGGVASVVTQPPFTLGMDVCGVVDAAGEGAGEWLGRRVVAVCTQSLGGLAERALASQVSVFDAPEELDDAEAAAFTLPFHTGYLALHERARLQPGETLLVVGGASAVGTAVIQLGVAGGAHVMATAGGREKGLVCEQLGAELAIDSTADDVFDRVMAHTDGRGADVACDMFGGDRTETIWTCMAHGGRYVPVGFNDDPQSGLTGKPLRKVSMGNFSVVGVIMAYGRAPLELRRFGVNPFPPETGRAVHAALGDLVKRGAIRPVIGRRIAMRDVAAALDDHEQRRTTGRTVVDLSLAAS
jgi:NADPH2:quinone reductase